MIQKYNVYFKDDLGFEGPALSKKDDFGDWCRAEEVDAHLAEVVRELRSGYLKDQARIAELEKALRYLIRHYVGQLENARDRIVGLGGQCDPVDVMERGDPHLRAVREVLGL